MSNNILRVTHDRKVSSTKVVVEDAEGNALCEAVPCSRIEFVLAGPGDEGFLGKVRLEVPAYFFRGDVAVALKDAAVTVVADSEAVFDILTRARDALAGFDGSVERSVEFRRLTAAILEDMNRILDLDRAKEHEP